MAKASTSNTDPMSVKQAALAQEIRTLMPELQRALLAVTDADDEAHKLGVEPETDPGWLKARAHADELEGAFAGLCDDVWAAPVRSFEDVVLLAEIVQHLILDWPAHGESDGLISPAVHYPDQAVARLLAGVLGLAGKPYNLEPTTAPC